MSLPKRVFVFAFVLLLGGCSAMEYGWDSPDFENQLVSTAIPKGKKRLQQIMDFDNTAQNLVGNGYHPEYIYEIDSDDFYFLSPSTGRHYRLVRVGFEVDSQASLVKIIPSNIIDLLPPSVIGVSANTAPKQTMPEPQSKYVKRELYSIVPVTSTLEPIGYEKVGDVLVTDLEPGDDALLLKVISDSVTRVDDSYKSTTVKKLNGYVQKPNLKKVKAQSRYLSAKRKYEESLEDIKVRGVSNAAAFLTGMLTQANRNKAEERMTEAHMAYLSEPDYTNEPSYTYETVKTPVLNFERRIKVEISKYDGEKVTASATVSKVVKDQLSAEYQQSPEDFVRSFQSRRIYISPSEYVLND